MSENSDSIKIAEAGKESSEKRLSKHDIKGMSKYKAQKILNEKDPQLLDKIEAEVAEKARIIKKRVMIAGLIIAAIVVGLIIYGEMNKNSVRPSRPFSALVKATGTF
jgi:hypothetical protein